MSLEDKKQTRTIGDHEYEVSPLPAGVARKVFIRLFKALGPSLASATRAGKNETEIAAGVLETLPNDLDEESFDFIAKSFGQYSKVNIDGAWKQLIPIVQDEHFAGSYGEMMKWLLFCVEVSFGNFFPGIRGGILGGLSHLSTE